VVKKLILDLANLECRLASLALAAGNDRKGSELLARAMWYLRQRGDGGRPLDWRDGDRPW
jgi:hypothetical protein